MKVFPVKKIIALSLASSSAFLMAGCGSSHDDHGVNTPQVSSTTSTNATENKSASPLNNTIDLPGKSSSSSSSSASLSPLTSATVKAMEKQGGVSSGVISGATQGGAVNGTGVTGSLNKIQSPTSKASSSEGDNAKGSAKHHVASGRNGAKSHTSGDKSWSSNSGERGTYSSRGGYTPPKSYVAPKAVNAPAPKNTGSIAANVYPRRIVINKIGMNKPINIMGLTARGLLDPIPGKISWYNRTVVPGKPGNSVILGHVTYNFYPDAFYQLPKLNAGDKITITYSNGAKRTFTVYAKASINKQALRTDRRVWGSNTVPTLVLATCDVNSALEGRYHRTKNIVVWAK